MTSADSSVCSRNTASTGLLLRPGSPTVGLLDHLGVWRRVYTDDVAILYVRGGG